MHLELSILCWSTKMAHPFMLEARDAVGAIVFQERKWIFCVARVLTLCLWGGRDPCQLSVGTELGVHPFLTSLGAVRFGWALLWRCCKKSACLGHFSFILHLHPTVHKEDPASVTWGSSTFPALPKIPSRKRLGYIWPRCLWKTKCLSTVSSWRDPHTQ